MVKAVGSTDVDPPTTPLDADGSHDRNFNDNFGVSSSERAYSTIFETEVVVGGLGSVAGIGGTKLKT